MLQNLKKILLPIIFIFIFFVITSVLFPNGVDNNLFSGNIPQISDGNERFITYSAFGNNYITNSQLKAINKNSSDGVIDVVDNAYKHITQLSEGVTITSMSSINSVLNDNSNMVFNKNGVDKNVMDKILSCGFDVVDISNSNLYNKKNDINSTMEYYKNATVDSFGINKSSDKNYFVLEYNNIKVGFISYIQNKDIELLEKDGYKTNILEKSNLQEDITNVKKESDVVIVNVHWSDVSGESISDTQKKYVNEFNRLGVNVILGYNDKFLQPVEMISNNGNETLVAYSLGNLLYNGLTLDENLGINLSFKITKKADGSIKISGMEIIPLVIHFEEYYNNYEINPLYIYNDKIAKKHYIYSAGVAISMDLIKGKMDRLYGDYLMKY